MRLGLGAEGRSVDSVEKKKVEGINDQRGSGFDWMQLELSPSMWFEFKKLGLHLLPGREGSTLDASTGKIGRCVELLRFSLFWGTV